MADQEFRSTPEKYPTVGALSRLVGRVDKFARAPFGYSNPPVEMLSDLLEIPALYRTGENIAYGSPLTIGAGQARRMTEDTTGAVGGALNLLGPAASTAKLAVKGTKAIAPRAGALAQQLAARTQPMPLQMNIVKPQGNLNLTPTARSEILKGPESQTADSFLNQLRGKPGMTKEGFDDLARRYQDLEPNTSMTKAEFEKNIPPSQYSKADLAHAANAADEHMLDEAQEMVMNDPSYVYESVLDRLGITSSDENIDLINSYHSGNLGFEELSPEVQEGLRLAGAHTPEGSNILSDLFHEEHGNAINEALNRLGPQESSLDSKGYAYSATQRLLQNPENSSKGYFEFGVTHPEQVDSYRHYPKYDSYDGGLIGHVRGTFIPAKATEEARLLSNPNVKPNYEPIFAKPNSMVIEEIQADAQKAKTKTGKFIDKQTGILRQSHGTVFKAAIQHALENGATTVYYPTARTIGNVRGKNASPYKTIYDQQIVKEGLNPLLNIPGVSSQKIGNAWYEIDFTPEATEFILKGEGQTAPGYAKGGRVKEGMSQVSDDPIGDFLDDYEMEKLRKKIAENEAALIDLTPVPTRVETGSDPMLLDVYPRLQREMEANPDRYEYGTARLKDKEFKRPMLSEDASREAWLEYKLRPRGQTDYSDKYPPGMELLEENNYYPRFGKRQPPRFKDKTPWDGYYANGGLVYRADGSPEEGEKTKLPEGGDSVRSRDVEDLLGSVVGMNLPERGKVLASNLRFSPTEGLNIGAINTLVQGMSLKDIRQFMLNLDIANKAGINLTKEGLQDIYANIKGENNTNYQASYNPRGKAVNLQRMGKEGNFGVTLSPDYQGAYYQSQFAQGGVVQGYGKGGVVKKVAELLKGMGVSESKVASKELTTLQDAHTSLGDSIRERAAKMQQQMDEMDFKYNSGQYVFTEGSAKNNRPPLLIKAKQLYGNIPMREPHPETPLMGKVVKDPATGLTKRTPYEPGYLVRREGPEGDWSEFVIPQSAIKGSVDDFAYGGMVQRAKGGAVNYNQSHIDELAERFHKEM